MKSHGLQSPRTLPRITKHPTQPMQVRKFLPTDENINLNPLTTHEPRADSSCDPCSFSRSLELRPVSFSPWLESQPTLFSCWLDSPIVLLLLLTHMWHACPSHPQYAAPPQSSVLCPAPLGLYTAWRLQFRLGSVLGSHYQFEVSRPFPNI